MSPAALQGSEGHRAAPPSRGNHRAAPPGQGESPAHRAAPSGQGESPAHRAAPPGQGESPAHRAAPPGLGESPAHRAAPHNNQLRTFAPGLAAPQLREKLFIFSLTERRGLCKDVIVVV